MKIKAIIFPSIVLVLGSAVLSCGQTLETQLPQSPVSLPDTNGPAVGSFHGGPADAKWLLGYPFSELSGENRILLNSAPLRPGLSEAIGITTPLSSIRWYLGAPGAGIGPEVPALAPRHWGQIGEWLDPWSDAFDVPSYRPLSGGNDSWSKGALPTEIGLGIPLSRLPGFGSLALSIHGGQGHLQSTPLDGDLTPPESASGLPSLSSTGQPLTVTHAAAALSIGLGAHSGVDLGFSAEDILRSYPDHGGLRDDASSLWDALRNLVNLGGASTSRSGDSASGSASGGSLPFGESYYRLSIGKSLSADGSAFARLTVSKVVYSDPLSPSAGVPGGATYSGAAGAMQLTFKF